jgi:diguanylate cyclase (GGDEF)-like protein
VRLPLLVALACALLPPAGRAERISLPTPAPSALMALQAQAEQAVELGYDHADAALAALRALAARPALPAGAERVFALARGLVAAGAGRDAEFGAAVGALHARADREPLAAADALLVQATEAMTQDRAEVAARHATAALNLYTGRCESTLPDADCNLRAVWRTRQMLALYSAGQGKLDIALQHAQAAVELARRADDLGLQARALALAADIKAGQGEQDSARRLFADAERMARLDGDALTQARLKLIETRITEHRGDALGARRAAEQGLGWARLADSPRLAGRLLTNLSDSYLKAGQARHALDAVEQALPMVRRYGERRTERVLLANRALARVALHRGASARAEMDPVIDVFAASGADAELAMLLREFADALANAGDLHGALELFHRERELVARTMARNREATLATLRERFGREAQQRDIELHSRENALRAAELSNQASARRLWLEVAVTAALAALVVALLYGRVRHINRRLAHNQARLRVQSEHDALTGLANRRRLHTLVQQRGASENFNGALLLVDIDHFKHINDEHGHAMGDVVLVEVARRLTQAVRDGDVVVRWGGEEFLIFAPEVGAAQALALATRVLQSVGGQAVAAGALKVAVTASVGYGSFSLPPHHPAMTLERAVNLVDMALYTAKNQGRNRAVGITGVHAADAAALAAVESDFDLAWQQGRVTLDRIVGPTAPERAAALAT